jgi:class 3 adenylate cyclase/tetratricopeptide (TPR) repeat protein
MIETVVRPEDLARFVPAFLVQRQLSQPGCLASSFSDPCCAAVLFADISGFTALSEQLAERGAEGVETLTQVLNGYFGQLIDLITAHGGDVIKFAGDALLAFWAVPSDMELGDVTRLAAQCGLKVQLVLQSYASHSGHRLSMRMGISAGKVAMVSVGGIFKRWEWVLVGAPVIAATKASAVGERGTVVVDAKAWKILQSCCDGQALSAEHVCLSQVRTPGLPAPWSPSPVTEDAVPFLLSYIPAAIHRRLAARQSAWLAEMRRLTVLFVNLPELNYQTPLEQCQEAMQALQVELYRFEGSVNKLSVDEKGVTLVAALGLPPLAHEDDGLRGVLAGQAMQDKLRQLGWHTSVGVTSGRVFCGTIGSEQRCEFTFIGDVVNMAARLMQAAHGSILCDELTYKAAIGKLDWQHVAPVQAKGKSQPIAAFKPSGPVRQSTAPQSTQGLVGRVDEQQRLEQLLHTLLDVQKGGAVLIEGEAGIGKSALVAAVLQRAQSLSLRTDLGAALAFERATPYFVWRPIFRQIFQLDGISLNSTGQREQVLAQLNFDPDLPPLAPLLDVVLSLDFADTAETAALVGEARLTSTNALLIRLLLRQTASAPLLLILEDCHWLDSASWALARQAVQQVPALQLVLVTRPLSDPPPRDYLALTHVPTTQRLVLSPLSFDKSLDLVKRHLGVADLPGPVADLLYTKSQGNPFFLEELAYALRDTGKIQVQNGQCRIATGPDWRTLSFPDTVQGVVTSRIDGLLPQAQLTLKVASVIGHSFSHQLLRDVCPIEDYKPDLHHYLETLIQHSLVVPNPGESDAEYSFKHIITQEVVYQMMPPAQRKLLHQAVAEWYERYHQADLSPFYALLAKHWSITDQVAKACDYLEKAGESAMRAFAHQEAVVFFTQALDLDEQAGFPAARFRRGCWERQLAEARYNLSELGEALEHFRKSLVLLGYPLPRSRVGFALSTLWEFTRQLAHCLAPRWFLGQAGPQAAERREVAQAYERVAQIYYLNNERVPAVHAAFRALNLSETAGAGSELARAYGNVTVACGLMSLHGWARAYAGRARAVADQVQQPSCTAYVGMVRGLYWVTVSDWEACEKDVAEATHLADHIGEKRRWYESYFTMIHLLSRKGDYRDSVRLSAQLHQAGTRHEVPEVELWGLTLQLWGVLTLEPATFEPQALETALAECLAANPSLPSGDLLLGHGLLALARWRRGDENGALGAARAAELCMYPSNQIVHFLLPAYSGLAEVYLGTGAAHSRERVRVQEMVRRTRLLIRMLRQFSRMYPIGRPELHLVQGEYFCLLGRMWRARGAWRQALRAAVALRMPLEEARAHLALGQHLPPNDPARTEHLARASHLFSAIGATHFLPRHDAGSGGPPGSDGPSDRRWDRN